jgi:VCBS repeat-containing protein
VTAGAYQLTRGGNADIFVARFNAAGSVLTYASYMGGNSADRAFAVAYHSSGRIYLTGETESNNFDVTLGALQLNDGGSGDAILSVIDPSQSGAASLVYSTYLGGSKSNERAWNISVDSAGRVYLAGSTDSDDFPTTVDAHRGTRAGGDDVFLAQINPVNGGASDLLYGSYFGGLGDDSALTGTYANGKLYFGGGTTSNTLIATAGAAYPNYTNDVDGFVAGFTFQSAPVVTVSATPLSYTEGAGAQLLDNSITVNDADSATLVGATLRFTANYVLGEDSLAFNNSNPWSITGLWSAAAGTLTLSGSSSVANYQAALRSVTYTNISQNPSTLTRSVTVSATDGETSSPPVVRQINVTSVNDVPNISAPASQTVAEDGTLTFSSAGANAIAVNDLDAGANPVRLTLTATNGTLTLFQTTGLSFTGGDGTGDAIMTFTGTIADINAALNGLRYDPTNDYNGAASVQINMSDLGNTGVPGPQIANRTV